MLSWDWSISIFHASDILVYQRVPAPSGVVPFCVGTKMLDQYDNFLT